MRQSRRNTRHPILRLLQVRLLIELPISRAQISHFLDRRGDVLHARRGEAGQIANLDPRRADGFIRVQYFPARVRGGEAVHQRTRAVG